MLIGPVLIILSSSLTVFATTQLNMIMERIALLGVFSPLIVLLLELLPFALLWGLFTFIYLFMPNTKVRFSSGLLGGIVAGTLFQAVQWGYITFQIGAAKYNAIYGSFAALPLFLIWLQLSWLIILYGAELSFAHHSVDTYEFEPDARLASHRLKTLLSLQIAHRLIRNFAAGEPPLTAEQISHALEIPIRLVNEILFELIRSGILSGTETDGDAERAFQPARDIHCLTIQQVIEAMELRGLNALTIAPTPSFTALEEALATFDQAVAKLPANRPLMDI